MRFKLRDEKKRYSLDYLWFKIVQNKSGIWCSKTLRRIQPCVKRAPTALHFESLNGILHFPPVRAQTRLSVESQS